MKKIASVTSILEPAKKIKVFRETDVVVVGGGPAGVGAAVAASRNGVNTVLVERYGHLGGMATGGLVLDIPHLSDGSKKQQIAGLCQEMIDRLDILGGAFHPKKGELGSNEEKLVRYYQKWFHGAKDDNVRLNVIVDPEMLKCVFNDMVVDAGVDLLLHSWGSRAITENNNVDGVVFESKSGRLAIRGKIIIDCTGDGDIFASAGADYDDSLDPDLRISKLALVFRIGQVDYDKYSAFKESNKKEYNNIIKDLANSNDGIYRSILSRALPHRSPREDIVWVNNWIKGLSAMNVEDLTWVEVNVRKAMLLMHDAFKKYVPGFEQSFIIDTASQIGTRGSRRLIGVHVVTGEDIRSGKPFDDTIAVFPHHSRKITAKGHPHIYIPYRALVPCKMEGLLVAGRCFSSDQIANDAYNIIPHSIAMGQAAGTAAALAVKNGEMPRDIDHKVLQRYLLDQDVLLPGVPMA